MARPIHVPVYNADEHARLIHELNEVQSKIKRMRPIRVAFTKDYRNAYMRHRMREQRGALTPEHKAEMEAARATYDRLTMKYRATAFRLATKARDLKRGIKLYQKASLYLR